MEVRYKRGLNHTYLIMEVPVLFEEDYQIKMIQVNKIEGLLVMDVQGVDGKSQYSYDIGGKVSLRAIYEKKEIERKELENLLLQLLKTVKAVQGYMLDAGKILFEPEYIFYEDGQYFFCYLPARDGELCQEFHHLTEYFVSRICHKEQDGIHLAYELHKETMEENYNLEKIIRRLRKREKEKKVSYEKPEIIISGMEDDWEEYEQTKDSVLMDASGWWRPKKKGKWGDWQ